MGHTRRDTDMAKVSFSEYFENLLIIKLFDIIDDKKKKHEQ